MKKLFIALAVGVLAVTTVVTAAFATSSKKSANADICVLLPDTKSSVRWETADRRYLAQNFKRAGVSYSIVNAEGDAQRQKSQADTCLANGAKVILLVNLDSGSGAAIQKAATAKGAQDDRLRPAHAERLVQVLRVVQQRRSRQAAWARGSSPTSRPGARLARVPSSHC